MPGLQVLTKHCRRLAASAIAGGLVLLLLWTAALAATPAHLERHSAKRASTHDLCVGCLFAHGQILASDGPFMLLNGHLGKASESIAPDFALATAIEFRLPQGRAPPVSFS
jgi:hypothetical protein